MNTWVHLGQPHCDFEITQVVKNDFFGILEMIKLKLENVTDSIYVQKTFNVERIIWRTYSEVDAPEDL